MSRFRIVKEWANPVLNTSGYQDGPPTTWVLGEFEAKWYSTSGLSVWFESAPLSNPDDRKAYCIPTTFVEWIGDPLPVHFKAPTEPCVKIVSGETGQCFHCATTIDRAYQLCDSDCVIGFREARGLPVNPTRCIVCTAGLSKDMWDSTMSCNYYKLLCEEHTLTHDVRFDNDVGLSISYEQEKPTRARMEGLNRAKLALIKSVEAKNVVIRRLEDLCQHRHEETAELNRVVLSKNVRISELEKVAKRMKHNRDTAKLNTTEMIRDYSDRHQKQQVRIAELETIVNNMDELHNSHDDLARMDELAKAQECARMEAQLALDLQKKLDSAPRRGAMDVEAEKHEYRYKQNVALGSFAATAFQTFCRWTAGCVIAHKMAWLAYQVF